MPKKPKRRSNVEVPIGRRLLAAGQPKRLTFLKKSSYLRRWCLRNPWIRPMTVFNYATVLIQKLIRGFIQRKRIRRLMRGEGYLLPSKVKNRSGQSQLDKYLNCIDEWNSREERRWM